MLKFEENYFQGEWREGFYVEPMMKRAWAAQLEVLSEIDKVCRKYNIRYFADWGTLLGAVRHKGFIPWDDDIDIAMLREDYEQFISVVGELPQECRVMDVRIDGNCPLDGHRVTNSREPDWKKRMDNYHGCPYNVGIDIFVLDNVPKDRDEREAWREMLLILWGFLQVINADEKSEIKENLTVKQKELVNELEKFYCIKFDGKKPLRCQVLELIEQLSFIYTKEECEELTQAYYFITEENFILKKKWYEESILMPFENIMIPAPKGYHEILTAMYGDYMEPVKNTQAHDYPFYKAQQKMIEDAIARGYVLEGYQQGK